MQNSFWEEYVKAVSKAKYEEHANLEGSIKMVSKGRIDALVIDSYIFSYNSSADDKKRTKVHQVFPGINYTVGFTDPSVRDKFNKGWQKSEATENIKKSSASTLNRR